MSNKQRLVVVGASAGGVETLQQLVSHLPEEIPGTIFIVNHVYPYAKSVLPEILTRAGVLPAKHPVDREIFQPGHIYIAPPNHHMLIEGDHIRLTEGPKENRHRPAIDPLFRSAAREHQSKVIGIILSGTLDDGVLGMVAINTYGGTTICQSPEEAIFPEMPENVLEELDVDYVMPVKQIAGQLVYLMQHPVEQPSHTPPNEERLYAANTKEIDMSALEEMGNDVAYICPDCGGHLWALDDGKVTHYRCHVGHSYSAKTLYASQSERVEEAFWITLRTLKEKAYMARQMAQRARLRNHNTAAQDYEHEADLAEQQAQLVRSVLVGDLIQARFTDENGT